MHPYDPGIIDDKQKVPSYGPGFFSNWGNKVAAVDKIVHGWIDMGSVEVTPAGTFYAPAASLDLQNLHIGKRVRAWTERHVTHGWTQFVIPGPVIQMAARTSPTTVRVEGYYFVEPDGTNSGTLSSSASSFNGTVGGSWVFFRDQTTGVEYPASSVTFETGTAVGRTVLGLDGAVQSSTGHILESVLPTFGIPESTYTVLVRQYRPYKTSALSSTFYHVDSHELPDAFSILNSGFGNGGFGNSGFGGS